MAPLTRSASKRRVLSSDSFARRQNSLLRPSLDGAATAPSQAQSYDTSSTPEAASGSDSQRDIFPFMDLPSELRLHIYRMALQRDRPILLHLQRTADYDDSATANRTGPGLIVREVSRRHQTPVGSEIVIDASSSPSSPVMPSRDYRPTDPRNWPATRAQVYLAHLITTTPAGINTEPLVTEILYLNKQIYREARPILYSDNEFVLHLVSATHALSSLHQRCRSMIKHVHLSIPTHHDVLEGFADVVRLGLRYCWGLKTLTLTLPNSFPADQHQVFSPTTNVYANAFHILRWLPKTCEVKLVGENIPSDITKIIEENAQLAQSLDDVS